MKKRLLSVLIILGLMLSANSISAEVKNDEASTVQDINEKVTQLQSDIPVIETPGTTKIEFLLDISEKHYTVNANTVEFYIKNSKKVNKAVWLTENCTIDPKTHIFTVKDKKSYLGKIVFVGDDADKIAMDSISVTSQAAISVSGILVKEVSLIKKDSNIYIKFVSDNSIISRQALQKNMGNNLLFVNRNNSLPDGYTPENLVKVDKNKIAVSNNSQRLLPTTSNALYKMIEGAKREKITGFIVNSTYRDVNFQRELFNYRLLINKKLKIKDPYAETQKRVALPGTSEHQTGLAIDILSKDGNSGEIFEKTVQSKWLKENSWKYGFVVRYTEDKQELTYTMYEPWHIRYMGYPCSAVLYKENLCFEEFNSYMQSNKIKIFTDQNVHYIFIHMDVTNGLSLPKSMKWEISQSDPGKYIAILSY